ncbi:MAG: hypothetical protein O3A75_07135 [Verrucomicrobia bacterium]|nr:hypothetical protein [Verrucomicrobiota bacterium]
MKANFCALLAFAALLGAVCCLRAQEPPIPTIATYAGLTFTEANSASWTIEATSDLSTPPIVSPDGEGQKGYLLYNGNSSDLQGAMLMRIRNGNYTNDDLAEFFAGPCYDTVDVNQPFVNGWTELRGN